jgi:hypothetical protein
MEKDSKYANAGAVCLEPASVQNYVGKEILLVPKKNRQWEELRLTTLETGRYQGDHPGGM